MTQRIRTDGVLRVAASPGQTVPYVDPYPKVDRPLINS